MNPDVFVKPCQEKTYQQGNIYCVFDENAVENFQPTMFDASYWQNINAITGSAQGRGTTWFIQTPQNQHWVLRHYYRGGMIGKFNKDSYWFTTQASTRAAREFTLLEEMQQLNLPAPKPIAYRIMRKGLFYQADLLSSRINKAEDLVAILTKTSLSDALWKKVGATIKRFHDHNIYHHDLNVHNILMDKNEAVFLIDFDRGERRSEQNKQAWQQANLARLQRSFLKEKNQLASFHWQADHWALLLEGYLASTPIES